MVHFKKRLIGVVDQIKNVVHALLLSSFVVIAIGIFSVFVIEFVQAFQARTEHSFLQAFGTLLILWTVTELINAEISIMKGGSFNVSILVDVAMASLIRKIMISDFKIDAEFIMSASALLIFALVRLMISFSSRVRSDSPAFD